MSESKRSPLTATHAEQTLLRVVRVGSIMSRTKSAFGAKRG